MDKIPLTKEGYEKLQAEFEHLKKVERPTVIEAIADAREHGDLKENAEYHAAREKQSFVEGRLKELESVIAQAEIIDVNSLSGDSVKFGATVELYDNDTEAETKYQIVGEYEADLDNGKLSLKSPIARALIGKSEGDLVDVVTPGGKKSYEILGVEFV